jgi:hypothetical protein
MHPDISAELSVVSAEIDHIDLAGFAKLLLVFRH